MNSVLSFPFIAEKTEGKLKWLVSHPSVRPVVELGFNWTHGLCRVSNLMQALVFLISLRGGTFSYWILRPLEQTDFFFFFSGDWAPEASPGLWGREAEGLPATYRKSRHVPLLNSVSSTPFGQSIPYAAERSLWAAQMWFGAVWGQFLIFLRCISQQSSGAPRTSITVEGGFWGTDMKLSRIIFLVMISKNVENNHFLKCSFLL